VIKMDLFAALGFSGSSSKKKKKIVVVRRKKYRVIGKPRVIKAVDYQKHRSKVSVDRRRKAMKPGKRISRTRHIYWETRKNRSDLRGGV